jgi:hypothetical protein
MQFLHQPTEKLLQGTTDENAEGQTKWDEVTPSGLKVNNSNINWSKLVHQPFTMAPHLDV